AAGLVSGGGLGAMYFGYDKKKMADPLRVGVIGTGDEGSVLIGALNPEYVQCVAIADIRPYNVHRAFHGDWASDAAYDARPGLMARYGWKSEDEAKQHVKVYDKDYRDLLKDENVEAIIIALPLHLHAAVAVEAMTAADRGWRKKPLHVLTEKLMAHNVAQCKVMGRVAEEQKVQLAVGHQRHYSVLYDNAVNMMRWGLLGELHHIRAQWHRGNLPGGDSWQQPLPGGEELAAGGTYDQIAEELKKLQKALKDERDPSKAQQLAKRVEQWKAWNADAQLNAAAFGYQDITLATGRKRTAMEELCRWRLWDRTGGGLMAELGSHQLDAASIFCSALRNDGKKAHPLTVHAVGGRNIFALDRDAEDHVYCMFEFPGPGYDPNFDVGYKDKYRGIPDPKNGVPPYEKDPNKKVVVTYSSIMGNGYGGYGEVVMGTKGTLILEREKEVMLYKDSDTSTSIGVKNGANGPTMDTQASGGGAPKAKAAEAQGPVSRGYTEEIEHFAYCIRFPDPENKPRCRAEVALG
ncbi:MAG TPA: Gfo/Idh/MocA family oxidoreductase, partial [Pirellulaceae bacterium]|nr:Gfo/Idh/MocA family oxidoreductase [Pirellulaceae bacterium]